MYRCHCNHPALAVCASSSIEWVVAEAAAIAAGAVPVARRGTGHLIKESIARRALFVLAVRTVVGIVASAQTRCNAALATVANTSSRLLVLFTALVHQLCVGLSSLVKPFLFQFVTRAPHVLTSQQRAVVVCRMAGTLARFTIASAAVRARAILSGRVQRCLLAVRSRKTRALPELATVTVPMELAGALGTRVILSRPDACTTSGIAVLRAHWGLLCGKHKEDRAKTSHVQQFIVVNVPAVLVGVTVVLALLDRKL